MNDLIRQEDMWDRAPRLIETPAARATDPITSHLAAEDVTRSGKRVQQQHQAAAAVRAKPGMTSFELAIACGLDRHMLGRRLPECAKGGAVTKGDLRECGITGHKALTWWPV